MSRSKLSQENLLTSIDVVLDGSREKKRKFLETIELVIVLKNIDPKRDKRFAGSIRIPHAPRPGFTVCVLGDEVHCDEAKAINIDRMNLDDLKKLNKDKKKVKKLVNSYHAFLASDTIIKQIPRIVGPGFNKAGKFPTPISHSENLAEKMEEVKSTIKFQMKRELCLHLAIANVGLTKDEVATNINMGVNYLASLTKKDTRPKSMGKLFLMHPGGDRIFKCSQCETPLSQRGDLLSNRFTGATGRAYLFSKAVNLVHGPMQERVMLTGRHLVRDVFCLKCNTKLGWIYEFAVDDSQRYKEGRVILERALLSEEELIPLVDHIDSEMEESDSAEAGEEQEEFVVD